MRVPNVPKSRPPVALLTIGDYLDAGIEVRSFCSSGQGHSHQIDLSPLVASRGRETPVDYALKVSLICPTCGAPGGGLEIRKPSTGAFGS